MIGSVLWTKASLLVSSVLTCPDSVDHGLLLSKLSQCGAVSTTIQWFRLYLSNRSQCSVIAGTKSQPLPITAGVPQGSVLGNNLFSVLINVLPSVFPSNCTTVLFAEDTTIYKIGSAVNHITSTLSSALTKCHEWMIHIKLRLNLVKTKCMPINFCLKSPPLLLLYLNDTRIEQAPGFKFLGCMVNKHLTWDDHIALVTNKVSRNINLLWRMSWFLP